MGYQLRRRRRATSPSPSSSRAASPAAPPSASPTRSWAPWARAPVAHCREAGEARVVTGVLPGGAPPADGADLGGAERADGQLAGRPLGRLVQHPHPRRGDAVLEDDRQRGGVDRGQHRERQGVGALGADRRRRSRSSSSAVTWSRTSRCAASASAAGGRRVGAEGRADDAVAPDRGVLGGQRLAAAPRSRCPRPARRLGGVVSHRRSRHASRPSWPRRPAAIEPSSAARAPDWSRQAAACEVAAAATWLRSHASRLRPGGAAARGRRRRRRRCPAPPPAAGRAARRPARPARPPPRPAPGRRRRPRRRRRPAPPAPPPGAASSSACSLVTCSRSSAGGTVQPATSTASPAAEAASRVRREKPGGGGGGGGHRAHPRSRTAGGRSAPRRVPRRRRPRVPRAPRVPAVRLRCAVPAAAPPGGSLTTSPRPRPDQRRRPVGTGGGVRAPHRAAARAWRRKPCPPLAAPTGPTPPPRAWRAGSSPSSAAAGYDLEELVVTPAGRRSVVRVVVDRDQGVTLDDIAEVSRAVSDVLDAQRRRHGPHALRPRGDQPRGRPAAHRAPALAAQRRPAGHGRRRPVRLGRRGHRPDHRRRRRRRHARRRGEGQAGRQEAAADAAAGALGGARGRPGAGRVRPAGRRRDAGADGDRPRTRTTTEETQ